MRNFTRREFLEYSAKLAALMGMTLSSVPRIAQALEQLSAGGAPVLWLQGQSCSGCSVSFLNSANPGAAQVLTQYISLLFHSTVSSATGATAENVIKRSIDIGGYYLVVEGAIPAGMPAACKIGHEDMPSLVTRAAKNAKAVLAVGTCASFGGIPAAENNPTGAMGLPDFLRIKHISTPAVRLPGCPCHPDWLVGTIVSLLGFGLPPLDNLGRPKMFYGKFIHDQCPRFADYERENFAKRFSDSGCLFKLGCLGTVTKADCPVRQWNSGVNNCIRAGAPCISCASEKFAASASVPFYRKGEKNR